MRLGSGGEGRKKSEFLLPPKSLANIWAVHTQDEIMQGLTESSCYKVDTVRQKLEVKQFWETEFQLSQRRN